MQVFNSGQLPGQLYQHSWYYNTMAGAAGKKGGAGAGRLMVMIPGGTVGACLRHLICTAVTIRIAGNTR